MTPAVIRTIERGYVDVTAEAGLVLVTRCGSPSKDHLLESTGSGVAFLDLDGDGRDDILVLNAWQLADREPGAPRRTIVDKGRFAYYRNRGDGTFADETIRAGLGGGGAWGGAVAAGDIDDDGHLDLYVACFGPNLLFHNRGDGTFEEVGVAAGVADPGWGGGATLFDADDDGDLDLYVTNYVETTEEEVLAAERTLVYEDKLDVMVGPFGLEGGEDRFYRNRGDGTFEDATVDAGLVDRARGYGLVPVAADLDDDGDLDLYVANDSNPNYLYRNEGDGRFREVGLSSGAAFSEDGAAQAGMGVEVVDLDGDRILDLFVTHFSDDYSTLYRGEGGLFFFDDSTKTGLKLLTFTPLSWGTASIDFDQNAVPDLVIANGHIYPQIDTLPGGHFRQRILLLVNRGGTYIDVGAEAGPGLQVRGSFRGLAVGDLDGDLDPDLVFTRVDEPPLLLRYDGGDRERWLVVAPDTPRPRWIGARIDVEASGRSQSRVILSGGSYASQSNLTAVFGLGPATRAERVTVRFPGGATREFRDVPGGRVLRVPVPH
ncbi:MAG: CRTAC1 family protein [Planctomycetes bacterium]|nr:CRTAC1 family protein [Planctomycetota bacterium]